ncbi:MAG: phosphatidate cytidylyltransferase [Candidatus Nanopelagicales bacterium]
MAEATTPAQPDAPHGRAGRNLVVAAGMGALLGIGLVLLPVVYAPWLFAVVISVAMAIGAWELAGAFENRGVHVERYVAYAGCLAMAQVGYWWGVQPLIGVFAVTVLIGMGARLLRGPEGYVADVAATTFVLAYTGLIGGFAGIVTAQPDGAYRVITIIVLTICSDIGGYVFGVLWGKHPMAPVISPKKSWEGFVGSLLFQAVAGVLLFIFLLGAPWWQGLITGLVMTVVATLGDFAESAIKRDLGVKDMSNLIPGHGGLMDRLDSILPNVIAGWLLLTLFLGS